MICYAIGLNTAGHTNCVTVEAEDALIAALKAKHEHPSATITYVRKANSRGDRRHPHRSLAESVPPA
ncbi:MAG: hypothetical protein RIE31_07790 [Alphaproteobacteria bacterium]